jgi:murein DD-endopeptidase MepM/ murein hydrolase activator NlpD
VLKRSRRLVALLTVITSLSTGVALAHDEEEPAPDPPHLAELVEGVQRVIDALTRASTLPDEDAAAAVEWLVARIDGFVGSSRVAAAQRVALSLPTVAVPPTHSLVVDGPPAILDLVTPGSGLSRTVDEVFGDWSRVLVLLDELQALVADRTPVRVCPVPGGWDFEDDWHDSRPWGRVHKGTDFHAPVGSPLMAIEAGTVIQANWHWAGGRQIYIRADSTGDVYYYAHLDSWEEWIWTGTRVEAGDVIGTLGGSGNATTPHLHFGWMPGSGSIDLDSLQNPYRLLVELCV